MTGTCRKNSSKFPTALLQDEMSKIKGSQRGDYVTVRKKGSRLLAFGWKDSGLVLGVTTGKQPFGGTVQRKMLRGETRVVPCPPCMECYNIYMGGVDVADHLRGGRYHIAKQITTGRWDLKLWIGLQGFALTNAYLLYKKFHSRAGHYVFFRQLSREMIAFGRQNTSVPPPIRSHIHRLDAGVVPLYGRCAAKDRGCLRQLKAGDAKRLTSRWTCHACPEKFHPECYFLFKQHSPGGFLDLPKHKSKCVHKHIVTNTESFTKKKRKRCR